MFDNRPQHFRKTIRKWFLRFFLTGAAGFVLLIITMLNPTLLYSHETTIDQVTIMHNKPLDHKLEERVRRVFEVLKRSELYDEHFNISLCLNEGVYPKLIKAINGPAFGHGFYNIAHISSEIDADKNTAIVNGYNWQLDQLIIHEIIHTYQYHEFGLMSKYHEPWKVEGYAEYVARQSTKPLQNQIIELQSHRADSDDSSWQWVEIYENSGVPLDYLHNHTLVRYMMEIPGMTYKEVISDSKSKMAVDKEMLNWLKQNRD